MNELIIGEKISEGRKKRGLSQAQFAEMLCVSAQAVGKWERGESMPDIMMFGKIAEIIGTDLNYFLNIEAKEVQTKNEKSEKIEPVGIVTPRDMSFAEWKGGDFSGLNNVRDKFGCSNVEANKFIGAELCGILFNMNNIDKNDFSKANLTGCRFSKANIEGNNFTDADFQGSNFSSSNIDKNNFSRVNFSNVSFKNSNIDKNIISGAKFENTGFSGCSVKDMVFESDMVNCSFMNCSFKKVEFKNVSFKNMFFKNQKLKKVTFINCKADRITYSFLLNCKADLTGITINE